MIIAAIIFGFFLAIILSPFIAIATMVYDRKVLRQMEELVDQYHYLVPADREANKLSFMKELATLKAKVWTTDKKSTERARDLFAMIA